MRKYSVELSQNELSNKAIVFTINQESFLNYLDQINKFQEKKITYSTQSKVYTHKKNNALLLKTLEHFKNKEMVVFDSESHIKTISDFELEIIKNDKHINLCGFDYSKALEFLKTNQLLDAFLNHKLFSNSVYYYSEYSRSFGERVNIKNHKEKITQLSKIQEYLRDSILIDEHESQNVYHCTRKAKVISFSYEKKHIILDDSKHWLEDLFKRNKTKETGFPYAKGEVFEPSVKELLREIE